MQMLITTASVQIVHVIMDTAKRGFGGSTRLELSPGGGSIAGVDASIVLFGIAVFGVTILKLLYVLVLETVANIGSRRIQTKAEK